MDRIKEFFSTYKKRICGYTMSISAIISFLLLVATYLFGVFKASDGNVHIIDVLVKTVAIFQGFSILSIVDTLFGLAHIIAIAVLVIRAIPFVIRCILLVRSLIIKDDDKLVRNSEALREGTLSFAFCLSMLTVVGYIATGYGLSILAFITLIFIVVSFCLSTIALMFAEHEELPLTSYLVGQSIRYVVVPTITVFLFKLLVPARALVNIFYSVSSYLSALPTFEDAPEMMPIIQGGFVVFGEAIFTIAFVIFFVRLFGLIVDNISEDSATYVEEKQKIRTVFLILAILTFSLAALRFIVYNLLYEGGASADFVQMLTSWFNMTRNDLIPAFVISLAGFLILLTTFRKKPEVKKAPMPWLNGGDSYGSSAFEGYGSYSGATPAFAEPTPSFGEIGDTAEDTPTEDTPADAE